MRNRERRALARAIHMLELFNEEGCKMYPLLGDDGGSDGGGGGGGGGGDG